jgi:CheY-like chemotaxis protein
VQASHRSAIAGSRVFVVEDEALIALLLEDMLQDLGCEHAATASSVDDALRQVDSVDADVALLDINVAGKEVFPVAERFAARGIPVAFSSGYDVDSLPEKWRARPLVRKPCMIDQLEAALSEALAGAPAANAAYSTRD